jgi:cytochrome c5
MKGQAGPWLRRWCLGPRPLAEQNERCTEKSRTVCHHDSTVNAPEAGDKAGNEKVAPLDPAEF